VHSYHPAFPAYFSFERESTNKEVITMIENSEARELCSNLEWELVESSFSPMLNSLLQSDLKSRLDRAIQLYRKTKNLVSQRHSESGKRTTRRKTQMFAQAIDRFEAALDLLENAQSMRPSPKEIHDTKVAAETRRLNMEALQDHANRELESRKSRVLSAVAVHGEQQGQKSGARHIQSHVGSANRRQQGRRDTKNR
jgi:hypothetical protein